MPKTGRPLTFDAFKQHTFLRLVAVGFSTRQAAKNVGVSPSTVREKARTSQAFAKQYEDAKDQSLPALAENIFKAGQKSWRASAWLLERLHPKQFGRRVALGPDRAKLHEQKRQQREAERQRENEYRLPAFLNEQIIREFTDRCMSDPRVRSVVFARLDEIDAIQAARDQPAESSPAQTPEPNSTAPSDEAGGSPCATANCSQLAVASSSSDADSDSHDATALSPPTTLNLEPETLKHSTPTFDFEPAILDPGSQTLNLKPETLNPFPPPGLDPSFYSSAPSANKSPHPDNTQNAQAQSSQPQAPTHEPPNPPTFCALKPRGPLSAHGPKPNRIVEWDSQRASPAETFITSHHSLPTRMPEPLNPGLPAGADS